jgi:hypothetical protein
MKTLLILIALLLWVAIMIPLLFNHVSPWAAWAAIIVTIIGLYYYLKSKLI